MKRSKRLLAFVLTLVMALSVALSGCSGDKKGDSSDQSDASSKEPTYGGSVVVGIQQDIDSLDPHKATAAGTKEILFNIFEGLVKPDENGNLIQHGHEHTHQHTHADGVSHTHAHTHDGSEGHDHTHNEGQNCSTDCGGCQGGDCRNETVALLTYMLQHNEHHAAELDQMADNLAKMGMDAAAKTIKESVSDFQKGNMRLGLALTLVKEEMK